MNYRTELAKRLRDGARHFRGREEARRFIIDLEAAADLIEYEAAVSSDWKLVPVEPEPMTHGDIFDFAMASLTRVQRNDWAAKDEDVIEFARAIEVEVMRRVREANK